MKDKQEKQIEEMAKSMCGDPDTIRKNLCANCLGWSDCLASAKALYAAGYRKASDVVSEFCKKLKEKFNGYEATYYNGHEESWHDLQQEIDELAAEFGAEGEK